MCPSDGHLIHSRSTMKIIIIVQARMTSTRLPGKVLLPVLQKPLLEYQIERLLRVRWADEVAIATTLNQTDQPIVDLCQQLQVPIFRGSEEDVLARYYETAVSCKADVVVRVTSDCPLIDPAVIDTVIRRYLDQNPYADYVSNTLERTFPRGMDTEVFSMRALTEAHQEAQAQSDREHVTPFIHRQSHRYLCQSIKAGINHSQHRWTVDTPEDFELIRRMLESLYPQTPHFSLSDCLNLIDQHPDWPLLNAHVEQKQYGE